MRNGSGRKSSSYGARCTVTIDRNEHLIAIGRVSGPVIVLVTALAFYLWYTDRIGGLAALGLMLLGPILGVAVGLLISHGSTTVGRALTNTITANLNIPPAPSFSYQESLVARGEVELAREAYEAHLAENPADLDARLALAALWRNELDDPAKAIELYLTIRQMGPSSPQEFTIGNALIDLYRATGQRGREMAELARFADRFAGTEAGGRAREALRRLKAG